MTLTELLIASALIGVVITGALSADVAIRTWQKRIEQRTMVQMDLMRAMEEITKNGRSSVGNGISQPQFMNKDAAISYGTSFLCFRQDPDPNVPDDDYLIVYMRTPNGCGGLPCLYIRHLYNDDSFPIIKHPFFMQTTDTFFSVNLNNGKLTSISVTLTTRPNPAKEEHPLTNPTYSLTTHFLPPGLSQ